MTRTLRDSIIIVGMVLAAHSRDIWNVASGRNPRATRTTSGSAAQGNVILVVADGLRWQEVFRGADSLLVFGNPKILGDDAPGVRRRYWRSTERERREALMPFLWSTVAREGQLFGNRDNGSVARVTNAMHFSYPGYNEMLVGYPDDARVNRNDIGPNPNVTVFEWMNRRAELRGRVGVVGTWTAFSDIFNERRSGLPIGANETDARSHAAAMRSLQRNKPRALFVGYGETDDWAHKARYDRTLDAAHAVDRYLSQLWSAVQAIPEYRGRTTVIVVADHGRGRTARDWTDHNRDVPGADETWVAVIGPNTPAAGEQRGGPDVTLSQTAATVAWAVGLDYRRAVPRAAPPLTAERSRSVVLSSQHH
jgi:type I phosphodiesterase/nucleotide pyrophosphatase